MKNLGFLVLFVSLSLTTVLADNGYRLWLRYDKLTNARVLDNYNKLLGSVWVIGTSPTSSIIKQEIDAATKGLLGASLRSVSNFNNADLIISKFSDATFTGGELTRTAAGLANDGFVIQTSSIGGRKRIVIGSASEIGLLYGTFHLIKLMQTHQPLENLAITSSPKVKIRILNHWDNLDRTVERGYAGISIWDWQKLPQYIDTRYVDYARANASIGINAVSLTNVNANALILTPMYLEKVKALADVFRPYGIKVYLTARFSAPIEIGGLKTADPLDQTVRNWWKEKVKELYTYVPDFGGFLVKANSEGQPGPQNYGRTHADGANMLAQALQSFGGVVMWRAFVYDNAVPVDRTKQAYNEFKPLDGKFEPNVIVQVKNGPLDFQPREPFHPLFGAMEKTAVMPEFQITQEYLGFATHLVYLGTLFKECLNSDTFVKGKGSTVAKTMDGSLFGNSVSAVAGVANIGSDINWTGHQFGQANWFVFGRLAWDHSLTAEAIAEEWIRMTFSNEEQVVKSVLAIMMSSRETLVNYMTPLGLHHIMGYNHHYGPGPWVKNKQREDWTSVYYHRADSLGVGFDRSPSGSNALEQYHPDVRKKFASKDTCPEEYLLWFHHVPWTYRTKSGKTLWEEMCHRYYGGVEEVVSMQANWRALKGMIDEERHKQVDEFLSIQTDEASLWRDACVLYFQQFSKKPIPASLAKPNHSLEYYEKLSFPYAPGIRPQW
jgi:alpha-glucuronidase